MWRMMRLQQGEKRSRAVYAPLSAAIIAAMHVAYAQVPQSVAPPERATSSAQSPARELPANTPISLQIDDTLVSGVSIPGSTFRMLVTDDVRIEGEVVIPAGSVAFGEVVDSKKAGMLGKAGVLVLSARYIHLDQRDIRLHSALGAAGDSMIAAALFVPFIRGKNATVSQGTRVVVRTAGAERF
jgi:hypothetical protein